MEQEFLIELFLKINMYYRCTFAIYYVDNN